MVKRHGDDAAIQAGMRADELLAEGDVDGAATWRAIIRAIEELQRTRRLMRRCSRCPACQDLLTLTVHGSCGLAHLKESSNRMSLYAAVEQLRNARGDRKGHSLLPQGGDMRR